MADERDDELNDEAIPEEELPDEALEEAAEEEPRLGELVRDEMRAGARDELKREFAETEAGQKIQAAKEQAKAKLRGKGASEAAAKEAAEEAGKTAVKAAATEATEVAAARTAGSWIARGVMGRILGAVVGSALLSEFPIIGTIVGFILGWILSDLIIRLLTSKTVQNCLLGALVMNALAAILVLAVLWGIYASLNRGDKGKTLTEPASIESEQDLANAELVKCLSEARDGETLSLECRHALEESLKRQQAEAELARNFLASYTGEADTAEALAALEEYEAALTALEAAGTNAKTLREQWPKLAEAKEKLNAATATLGEVPGELGLVRLDVPVIDQPRGGACGYTSATMVGQYFVNNFGDGRTLDVNACPRSLLAGVNVYLDQVFPDGSVQYSDYAGAPNDTYFGLIASSLAKGAPVLLGTDFYADSNGIGHYIVIRGYNPSTGMYIANNPLPGGSEGPVTQIAGVELTRENIAAHARHLNDGYVVMYYAGDRNFR